MMGYINGCIVHYDIFDFSVFRVFYPNVVNRLIQVIINDIGKIFLGSF